MKHYCVYILTNKPNGVLYIGSTENLVKRVQDHKNAVLSGFLKIYNLKKLVYFETYENPQDAALREKRMKGWKRDWKISLIEEQNPEWRNLYQRLNE